MDGAPTHPTRRYPVLVDLDGAHCLVVGGGPVAERRVSGLLDAGARVTVVAPHLTAGLQARGEGGHLRILAEPFGPALLEPERGRTWRLVVAATVDRSVNAEVVRLASGLGLWVNDASDPTGGPVAVPAVARAGAVTVAVSTGGVSPGAAAWLRDLLAASVPAEVVEALDLLAEVAGELAEEMAREAAVEGAVGVATGTGAPDEAVASTRSPRPDWRMLLDSGMLVDIREGRRAVAKERLKACLSSSSD